MKGLVAGCCLALLAVTAYAQDQSDDIFELGEIVVSSPRTISEAVGTVQVVTAEDIQRTKPRRNSAKPRDPNAQPTVAGECAFGLENLGWKVERMREMVRRSLSAVGLNIPWNTPTRTLSWRFSYGRKRLLALASVLILHPRIHLVDDLIQAATDHVHRYFQEGSDPGLCIACETDKSPVLENFGRLCSAEIVTQKQAFAAGSNIHLSGHGGTNDGIIGALAAVGLTMSGWGGKLY